MHDGQCCIQCLQTLAIFSKTKLKLFFLKLRIIRSRNKK